MGSAMNGMALHGGIRPYGATFLVFSDYMKPAIRLAGLMKLPVDLHLYPRFYRTGRRRTHPPADRASGDAPRHPEHAGDPSR